MKPQARRPGRTNVYIEGRFAFAVDAALLEELGVRVGTYLDDPRLEAIQGGEERRQARERALHYLTTRERSRHEVRERLRRYGYPESLVVGTVEWLVELGYVDDRRFAEALARARYASGWGIRRVRDELFARGIDEGVVREAAGGVEGDPAGEDARLARLAEMVGRRFGVLLRSDPIAGRRRAVAYLQRRGHDWETVERIMGRVYREGVSPAHCEQPWDPND